MSNETMLKRIEDLMSALSIDWSVGDIEYENPESAYMVAGYLDATINVAYSIAQRIRCEIQEDMERTEAYWKEYKEKEAANDNDTL